MGSAILANVYLHYVLDVWFEAAVQKEQYRGEAYLTRYADDFVACFQHKEDAEKFYEALGERMEKFGLALAPEKTRILEFGRYAEENRNNRGQGKPETFNFLGFTFYGGKDRSYGSFRVKVKSDRKKSKAKLKKMKIWLEENRNKLDVTGLIARINRSLQGYYSYYAVSGNLR